MIEVILVTIMVLLTFYIIYYVIYPSITNTDVLPKMTPLNVKKDIVMPDVAKNTILGSNGSTIMGYIKLMNGDRTTTYENGKNKFIPLLQSDQNWYFEVRSLPNDTEKSSARLRVIKLKPSAPGGKENELIELPPFPKQKWVFLAILREGRRFDVIYDNQIVASKRMDAYPAVVSSPVSIGNKGLDGSAIHFMINGERLNPTDVEHERLAHIDTNRTVIEDNSLTMSFPAIPNINIFSQCPPGLPCDPVTKPPNNQVFEWSSPYA